MLIESWINEQSPSEKRGQVLSIYRMVDLIAVTIGQFLLNAADPKDYILFSVVAILISLAIFPVFLSKSRLGLDRKVREGFSLISSNFHPNPTPGSPENLQKRHSPYFVLFSIQ